MIKIKKQYFPHVVKDVNILILGDDDLGEYDVVFEQFHKKLFQEITPHNVENLNSFVLENNIKMIILNTKENRSEIATTLKQTMLTQDVRIGICCNLENSIMNETVINMSDVIFTKASTADELLSKIYNILYVVSEVTHIEEKPTAKSAYKDAFEVDVMILSEELHKLSDRIDGGDISDEVFDALHKHISKVAQIVNGYMMSSDTIKKFIQLFDKFLQTFDKNKVSVENIEGFDYLARLVEDIAVFLEKYFVEKKFDDIYVVEDSLRNSFEFMRDKFAGKKASDDKSDLEFF
jgi:hypothetical protein